MPDVILKNLPFLLHGLWLTVELSAWSIVLGTLLGLLVGTIRFVRVPVLNVLAAIYVEFIRGTPLLVVLFIGYRTTAYRAAIFGFVLFIAAYLAEDFRAGLRAVRPTLIQAGLATGLTRWQVLRHIILPQAIRRVLPSLFNQYVRLIKFTSVASVIGVTELTGAGLLINARDFHPVKILATIAIVYLVVCSALSLAGRALYAQFGVRT
jgi:His/Glu/Gln/Arg/opine family amino acid ABC transporter permease subunit